MKVIYFKNRKTILVTALTMLLGTACLLAFLNINSTPAVAQPYYSGAQSADGVKRVSLAINVDWGEEFIPDMLKVLEQAGVSATFFLTGRWTDKNPELAKTIAEQGHEIGNHAYSHKSPNALSLEANKEEIRSTAHSIKEAVGYSTVLYAPPSGEREPHVLQAAEELGYVTVLWSLDTVDWKRPPASDILKKITSRAKAGDIILMHPTHPTLAALPEILAFFQQNGFQLVTVSENLGI